MYATIIFLKNLLDVNAKLPLIPYNTNEKNYIVPGIKKNRKHSCPCGQGKSTSKGIINITLY
jgi:hypothetical protein